MPIFHFFRFLRIKPDGKNGSKNVSEKRIKKWSLYTLFIIKEYGD